MTSSEAPNEAAGPGDITQCLLALRHGGRDQMDALFLLSGDDDR